jgi:hypothetical protein
MRTWNHWRQWHACLVANYFEVMTMVVKLMNSSGNRAINGHGRMVTTRPIPEPETLVVTRKGRHACQGTGAITLVSQLLLQPAVSAIFLVSREKQQLVNASMWGPQCS